MSHRTHTPFIADHPHALAVYCSDGRFTEPVEELLRELGHGRLDTLTMPGGPGLLNPLTASYGELDAFRKAASFLIDGHAITEVFLVAHAGCGYYRKKMAHKKPEEIVAAQLRDLDIATKHLERAHTGLAVRCYFAKPVDGRVQFELR